MFPFFFRGLLIASLDPETHREAFGGAGFLTLPPTHCQNHLPRDALGTPEHGLGAPSAL